jgi:hypothetical protein
MRRRREVVRFIAVDYERKEKKKSKGGEKT